MSITDYAGATILGRHPEHGFLIDGEVRRDVADLLCQHGFRHDEDNNVFVLPADMPEDDARDMLSRAAQVLITTRHSVKALSDQQAAEMAAAAPRIQEAISALTDGRDRLLAMVGRVHGAPGCLPVPQIRVPANRDELDVESRTIYRNLFTGHGHRAPRWVAAQANCTHLPTVAVPVIYDAINRWYQLLNSAARHIDDGNEQSPYDLAWCVERLDTALAAVPPAPERNVEIHPATVADLNDGDEFSVDAGQTWHVCGEVLFGTVSVYTGEHDPVGEPLLVRIEANQDLPCLVRHALTA